MEPLRERIGRTSVVTLRPLSMSTMIWNEGGRGRGLFVAELFAVGSNISPHKFNSSTTTA